MTKKRLRWSFAPIFDNSMNPIAAISISMPVNEESDRKLHEYKDYIVMHLRKH